MAHNSQFLKLVNEAKSQIKEVTIDDVHQRQTQGANFHLVDVREDLEWEAGRIKGAIHLGKGVIERDIEKNIPDTNAEIILYCGGGFRSALAAEVLQKMGYTKVASMDGGIRAWREADYPQEG